MVWRPDQEVRGRQRGGALDGDIHVAQHSVSISGQSTAIYCGLLSGRAMEPLPQSSAGAWSMVSGCDDGRLVSARGLLSSGPIRAQW